MLPLEVLQLLLQECAPLPLKALFKVLLELPGLPPVPLSAPSRRVMRLAPLREAVHRDVGVVVVEELADPLDEEANLLIRVTHVGNTGGFDVLQSVHDLHDDLADAA